MVVLDNLGLMLAKIFRSPTGASQIVSGLQDITGAIFSAELYGSDGSGTRWNRDGVVRQVQVGKGLSPVTRQDFKIESPFPDAPESVLNNCSNGVYNSGLGKIAQPCLISSTGGAGTITEVIKIWRVRSTSPSSLRTTALFRDIVSPVNFIASEAINTEHTVLI